MIVPLRAAALAALLILAAAPSLAGEADFDFSVLVGLTPKAEALMKAKREKIIVWASWYGDPANDKIGIDDEAGHVVLGNAKVRIAGDGGLAKMPSGKVASGRLKDIKNGAVKVLVNVYSARLSARDNLLDCGIFDGSLEEARRKPAPLICGLIGE